MRIILFTLAFMLTSCGIAPHKFNEFRAGTPYSKVVEKIGNPYSMNIVDGFIVAEFSVHGGPDKILVFDQRTEALVGMKDDWDKWRRDQDAMQEMAKSFQKAGEDTRRNMNPDSDRPVIRVYQYNR